MVCLRNKFFLHKLARVRVADQPQKSANFDIHERKRRQPRKKKDRLKRPKHGNKTKNHLIIGSCHEFICKQKAIQEEKDKI